MRIKSVLAAVLVGLIVSAAYGLGLSAQRPAQPITLDGKALSAFPP